MPEVSSNVLPSVVKRMLSGRGQVLKEYRPRILIAGLVVFAVSAAGEAAEYSPYVEDDFPMELLWGDTHVHSSFSMDANVMGNARLDPGDAYRFARGETVIANTEQPVRLDRPLDFLVVSDHAE